MQNNIDNIFTNMMNDFNFTQSGLNSPSTNNRNQHIPSNPSMRYVNRQLDTIYDMLIRYNEVMTLYQRNMTQMISLINMNNNTFRQRLQEIRSDRNNQRQQPRFTYRNVPLNQWTWTHQTPLFSNLNQTTPRSPNNPLTQREIQYLTTTITYNEETRNVLNETRCPISLENFRNGDILCKINGCNHVFKKDNLLNWFRRNTKCPICRFNLRSEMNRNRRNTNSRNNRNDISGGVMRDPSGNRLDVSNNIAQNNDYNQLLDQELTTMMQNLLNLNGNYFDISYNIQPLYTTRGSNTQEQNITEENNEETIQENTQETAVEDVEDSDDDSSVIQDNLSVD